MRIIIIEAMIRNLFRNMNYPRPQFDKLQSRISKSTFFNLTKFNKALDYNNGWFCFTQLVYVQLSHLFIIVHC